MKPVVTDGNPLKLGRVAVRVVSRVGITLVRLSRPNVNCSGRQRGSMVPNTGDHRKIHRSFKMWPILFCLVVDRAESWHTA